MKLRFLIIIIFALTTMSQMVKAQLPEFEPPLCVEYFRSDVVFSGTFIESVYEKGSSPPKATNTFRVNNIIKGKSMNTAQVKFFLGGEGEINFEVGKEYLVYAVNPKEGTVFYADLATRTKLLEWAQNDLKQINKLHKSKNVYFVEGEIDGLSTEELKQVKVFVRDGNSYNPVEIGRFGKYEYDLTKDKKIAVIVEIPFEVDLIRHKNFKVVFSSAPTPNTRIEYEVNGSTNGCDYKKIIVRKKQLILFYSFKNAPF